jgi:hypothetical protein
MTFLEALKTGRPMRRRPPPSLGYGPWIVIGDTWRGSEQWHPWIRIDNGKEITLASWDYLAEDWEVMP